jgi:hypothetical protein
MKKKLVAAGVLAGGIALTGLAGSAYAQGGTPAVKPTGPKGQGAIAIACVKGAPIKGKPGKGLPEKGKVVSIREPGKLPALPKGALPLELRSGGKAVPAPGAKLSKHAVKILTKAGAQGMPKLGPLPKGAHCTVVKPGTPGAPPAPPAG